MSIRKVVDLRDLVNLLYTFFPLKWLLGMARLQGRFDTRRQKGLRNRVAENLRTTFPDELNEESIEKLTIQFFEFHRMREILKILLPRLSPGLLDTLVHFEGLEHLDEALAKKNGVVLLGSHLNSTFNFPAIHRLRQMGYDVHVVMPTEDDPFAPSLLGKLVQRIFRMPGLLELAGAFYAQFNVRPIIRCLSENGVPVLLGDGFHSTSFVKARLLGHDIALTTGPSSVARITGAPLVPFFMVGSPPYGIRVVFKEPIWVDKTNDPEKDLQLATAIYTAQLDSCIRENIPTWQHWEFDHVLQLMDSSLERSLAERLSM